VKEGAEDEIRDLFSFVQTDDGVQEELGYKG
jgi:hypothetical protein